MTANDLAGVWPRRASDAHKGDHGHVLLIGGNTGMGGAFVLAAQAALRVGAGLVSAFSRRDTLQALLIRQPECMGLAVDEEAVASAAVQRAEQRANALVLGPGMWTIPGPNAGLRATSTIPGHGSWMRMH